MNSEKFSRALLRRLPVYLKYLKSLTNDDPNISAAAIARDLGLSHVLVRKDLARVSGAGRCKTGRPRNQLIQDIENYLTLSAQRPDDTN